MNIYQIVRNSKSHLFAFLLFAVVFCIAIWLRWNAFWMPHWIGDQSHYVALAVKLKTGGLENYNLREIELRTLKKPGDKEISLVYPKHSAIGKEGDILKALKIIGQGYYDEPLHMRAPLFPYALLLSHRILSTKNQPFTIVLSNLGEKVKRVKPVFLLEAQFWAVIVPFMFNLSIITMTFLIGRMWFDTRIAFYAAFLMATNAVCVLTAHRLWTEDMLSFFLLISLVLFHAFYCRRKIVGVFISGCLAGLAILTKQTAGLVLVMAWILSVLMDDRPWSFKTAIPKVINRSIMIYGMGAFLVSAFWFLKVIEVYGEPLHLPSQGMDLAQIHDRSGWFAALAERPAPILFFSLGPLYVCPLFAALFLTFGRFRSDVTLMMKRQTADHRFIILWVWLLVFFYFVGNPTKVMFAGFNQEHRYLYPAFPAIAILAAFGLDRLRVWFGNLLRRPLAGELVILVLLVLNACWSVPMAMKIIFEDRSLF